MNFALKRILLNFYLILQIFAVSMGLLCSFISYAEKDPLKENIPSDVEEVKNSVVKLFITTNKRRSTGTGFILEDGLLVTNAHVLLDKSDSFVNKINSGHLSYIEIFQEGQLLDVQVTSIQALDPIHDLALLNIKGDIPPVIKKHQGKMDLTKEKLFFVGYPYGKLKAMGQKGPIEIFESKAHTEVHMPVSNNNNNNMHGASGSPVVNQKGEIMGVLHSGSNFENKVIFSNNDLLFSLQNAEYGVQCSKSASIKNCFQQAEDFHLKEAKKGDVFAQYKLGLYYFIDSEYIKALKWLNKAAQQKFVLAQYQLGSKLYALESYKESFKWFKIANQNGYKTSMYLLGFMHYHGQGVPQNYKKAFQYFELAAQQGNSDAYFALGIMYDHGQGVPQDFEKAFEYLKLAAQQGNKEAQNFLKKLKNNKKCIKIFNKGAQ